MHDDPHTDETRLTVTLNPDELAASVWHNLRAAPSFAALDVTVAAEEGR